MFERYLYDTFCTQHDFKKRFLFVAILIELYIPM